MITMEKHLTQLVARGVITRDTAVQYANDPSQMVFAPNGQPAPSDLRHRPDATAPAAPARSRPRRGARRPSRRFSRLRP